jgi:hypothetical protein
MYLYLKLILAFGVLYSVGKPIEWCLFKNQSLSSWHRLSLSYAFGTGISAWVIFLYLYGGGYFRFPELLVLLSPFIIAGVILQGRGLACLYKRVAKQRLRFTWAPKLFQGFLILSIGMALGIVVLTGLLKPVYRWDSVMFWAPKAKMLFCDGTIYSDFWFDPNFIHMYRDRPLLIPILEGWIFVALGKVDDQLVKILFPSFFICLLLLFYHEQRRYVSSKHALMFTGILATLPVMIYERWGKIPPEWSSFPDAINMQTAAASTSYLDLPLCLYLSAGFLLFFCGLHSGRSTDFIGAGLFLAFVVFTKPEGLVYIVLLGLACILASYDEGYKTSWAVFFSSLIAIVVPLLMNTPWFLFKNELPQVFAHDNTFSFAAVSWGRIPKILPVLFSEVMDINHWGLLWVLLACMLTFSWGNRSLRPITSFLVLYLLFLCVLYLSFEGNFIWLMDVSLARILMHPLGVIVFYLALAISDSNSSYWQKKHTYARDSGDGS